MNSSSSSSSFHKLYNLKIPPRIIVAEIKKRVTTKDFEVIGVENSADILIAQVQVI